MFEALRRGLGMRRSVHNFYTLYSVFLTFPCCRLAIRSRSLHYSSRWMPLYNPLSSPRLCPSRDATHRPERSLRFRHHCKQTYRWRAGWISPSLQIDVCKFGHLWIPRCTNASRAFCGSHWYRLYTGIFLSWRPFL